MASDTAVLGAAVLRRAATPFLAGAAATGAMLHGLYATATLALLVGLWAAAIVQQAVALRAAPIAHVPQPGSPSDGEEGRRLTQYLDLSPAPLVALDARDRLSVVNRAARLLLAAEGLVKRPPITLVETILATPPGRSATVSIDTGSAAHSFAILTADVDAAHGATRIAALVDIDADLKAAEAATLRDLVQVLSHEINNTLTPIASLSATAALMMRETPFDLPGVRAAVETVARRADGLRRFGAAYRELARLPPPTIAWVHLGQMAADLHNMFAASWADAVLTVSVKPAELTAELDADQVAQALWALLQNAAEVAHHVELAIVVSGGQIRLRITDDGPGVAPAEAEAIFRPFFTTKSGGSGIGLALARQIFRSHRGELSLDTGDPEKTVFDGTMPVQHASVAPDLIGGS